MQSRLQLLGKSRSQFRYNSNRYYLKCHHEPFHEIHGGKLILRGCVDLIQKSHLPGKRLFYNFTLLNNKGISSKCHFKSRRFRVPDDKDQFTVGHQFV